MEIFGFLWFLIEFEHIFFAQAKAPKGKPHQLGGSTAHPQDIASAGKAGIFKKK